MYKRGTKTKLKLVEDEDMMCVDKIAFIIKGRKFNEKKP